MPPSAPVCVPTAASDTHIPSVRAPIKERGGRPGVVSAILRDAAYVPAYYVLNYCAGKGAE